MTIARRFSPWAVIASLLLHSGAYASLGMAPVTSPAPLRRQTQLRFDIVAKAKKAEPEPEPAPPRSPQHEPTKATAPKPPSQSAPPRPQRSSTPASPPEVPAAAAPAGVTLAASGEGAAFAMPLGNGGALNTSRISALTSVELPVAPRPSSPIPTQAEPPLVAVKDLSSKPSPPALGAALERHYPAEARRRGLSGVAKVRARIDHDGVVRRVSLLEESGTGFGSACTRALQGSRWAPPKDKAGRAVATEIRYTCRFVVE